MGRQIIQTNGPGRIRAVRRRAAKAVVTVTFLILIVAVMLHRGLISGIHHF